MRIGGHWGQETGRHGIERGKKQAKEKKAIWVRWGKRWRKIYGRGGSFKGNLSLRTNLFRAG